MVAMFAVALAWRLSYLSRLADSPLDGSRLSDSRAYWDWASYLLANGPVGRNPFFLAPLYPYVLAGIRSLLGDDAHRVLVVQAIWGSCAAALLADAVRRVTRPALGVAAGTVVAFSRMATFFDGLVLAESLLAFLGTALLWSVVRTRGRAVSNRDVVLWGALIGLLSQGRATALLFAAPALVLAWVVAGSRRIALERAAALLFALTLVCLPTIARNRAVSGEWIPFTYNGGYNLYVGNHPDANGSFTSITGAYDIVDTRALGADGGIEVDGRHFIEGSTGERLTAEQSSRWWTSRALQWMRANPLKAGGLWLQKAAMAWSRHESPQIENVDEFELLAGPVGVPWLGSFAVLAALAMGGAFLAWRRGPHERFVASTVLLTTIALMCFFVTDRHRHHLVPGAILLSSIAVHEIWRARGRGEVWVSLAPGAALGAMLSCWPVPHLSGPRYQMSLAGDIGMRWLDHGRADLAEPELAKAIGLDQRGAVHWNSTPGDSSQRGMLYFQHARVLTALSREAEALSELRRASVLAPRSRAISDALAFALAAAGNQSEAAQLYARSGRPEAALDAMRDRAWALARSGRYPEAEQLFSEIVTRAPERFDVWGALVRLQAQAGNVSAARVWFEKARAAGWNGPACDAHAALLLLYEGRRADALRIATRIRPDDAELDPASREVRSYVAQQGLR